MARARPLQFQRGTRVDRVLLDNLRDLRTIVGTSEEKRQYLDAFVGRAIFLGYLQDRGIVTADHLEELSGFRSYIAAVERGVQTCYRLFEELGARFDGDIFAFSGSEVSVLTDADLDMVGSFLRGGNLATGQEAFFPYDFSVIPPELISSIYEQLLEDTRRQQGTYYTPRHLVDMVLDEVLPWGKEAVVRILDPACGSGTFLSECFRRLLFAYSKPDRPRLSYQDLSSILTESIFGVDQNDTAINVAAFGLYLSLLEEVDPPTAWRHARLPKLKGRNLIVADFFERHPLTGERFDLVVGNPPWQSALTEATRDYIKRQKRPVSDLQAAQAFFWKAQEILRPGGAVALILPAKPFLYNRSARALAFRERLLDDVDVETIIDLSPVRRTIFSEAVAPGIILVAKGKVLSHGDSRSAIVHVVPRITPLHEAVDGFVVSQEDVHLTAVDVARHYPYVWKLHLWGEPRSFDILARLRTAFPTLGEIGAERGWVWGQGFQVKGGDANSAEALLGMTFVPTRSVMPFRVQGLGSQIVSDSVMHRPRDPRLYRGPHVLVRRGLVDGRLAAVLVGTDAAFNNGIFGIAAPGRDLLHLRLLVAYLNSLLAHYYHFLTSSSWGVERDFVEVSEHLSLPFPELTERSARPILQALTHLEATDDLQSGTLERLDEAVFSAYELSQADVEAVRETVEIGLDLFRRGKQSIAFSRVKMQTLDRYGRVLAESLRSHLPGLRVGVEVAQFPPGDLCGVSVTLDEPDTLVVGRSLEERHVSLRRLIEEVKERIASWPSSVSILQPSALILDESRVHVVKPVDHRFWTVTRARADAADIIGHVSQQGPEAATGRR